MEVQVYTDSDSLSRAAADLFVRQAQDAVRQRGIFTVAFSGGNTPQQTYALLAKEPWVNQMPWERTYIFWGDERCVPKDDPRHNAHNAFKLLLDHVPIPSSQIHPIYCEKSPVQTVVHYEKMLREFFKERAESFDLNLLGLGNDGHTASLFPGTTVLNERNRWVSEVLVPAQEFSRITLTIPLLERSLLTVFMVEGDGKAGVLKTVLEGPFDPINYPAQLIQPLNGKLIWMADQEAARLLSQSKP